MFVTKKSLSRRTVLQSHGRGRQPAISGIDDSGLHAAGERSRGTAAPIRRRLLSERRHHAAVHAGRPWATGFEFTPILKPLEPFKNQLVVVTNFTRSHPGSQVGDHAVSAAGFLTGVWPKRTEAEDVLANTTIDQIIAQTDRTGYAAAVAGTGDGGFHRLRRRLLPGIQLRLHEHDLVAHADNAASDGNESACGIRKNLRRGRHRQRNDWSAFSSSSSLLDSISEEASESSARAGPAGSRTHERLSRQHPRDRAPHSADRTPQGNADRNARARRWVCRIPSTNTWT